MERDDIRLLRLEEETERERLLRLHDAATSGGAPPRGGMDGYQKAVAGGRHSYGRDVPCPACGDLDGCHRWRETPEVGQKRMRRVAIVLNMEELRPVGLAYMRAIVRDCLARGDAPSTAWALYPSAVDFTDPAELIGRAIEAQDAWDEKAEAVLVYEDLGTTDAMTKNIERHKKAGLPVELPVERFKIGWSPLIHVGSRVRVCSGVEGFGGCVGEVVGSDDAGRLRFQVKFVPLDPHSRETTWLRLEDLEVA